MNLGDILFEPPRETRPDHGGRLTVIGCTHYARPGRRPHVTLHEAETCAAAVLETAHGEAFDRAIGAAT